MHGAARHRRAVLAFDVGGTDIKSALIDADGTVLGLRRTPTPPTRRPAAGVVASIGSSAHAPRRGAGHRARRRRRHGPGSSTRPRGWASSPATSAGATRPSGRSPRPRSGSPWRSPTTCAPRVRPSTASARRGRTATSSCSSSARASRALILDGRPYPGGGYAGEIGHSLADPRGEPCACGATRVPRDHRLRGRDRPPLHARGQAVSGARKSSRPRPATRSRSGVERGGRRACPGDRAAHGDSRRRRS